MYLFSNPLVPLQGWRWPEPIPAAQGTKQETITDGQLSHRVGMHTHTNSRSLRLGVLDACNNLMSTTLGCGRKLEHPEKTHTDILKVHSGSGPG